MMNEEKLRAAMDALFAQYGGPIEPFMGIVNEWSYDVDMGPRDVEGADDDGLFFGFDEEGDA